MFTRRIKILQNLQELSVKTMINSPSTQFKVVIIFYFGDRKENSLYLYEAV